MSLDLAAAERAVGALGQRLGLSPVQAAWAIHQLVNEHMAAAARIHVIERAKDPRRFALLAFGGGGPVHAAGVAKALNVRQVVCPPGAGVASAIGLLVAPASMELTRSYPVLMEQVDWDEIATLYQELETQATRQLGEVGVRPDEITFQRAVDGRFAGQLHEIEIPLPPAILSANRDGAVDELQASFFRRYEELYKHLPRGMAIEMLSWRLTAHGPAPNVAIPRGQAGSGDASSARKGSRQAFFQGSGGEAGGFVDTPVYDRYALRGGMRFTGPAIVEERESTIVVGPGMSVDIDDYLNVVGTL
jgi:5-oxoprolinase (ATP-hydrolysing)/N-methylhydantoinase A